MNDTSRQKHTGDNESVSRMIMSVIAGVAALVIIVLIYSSMGNTSLCVTFFREGISG